jgi:hypothetical protein
MNDRILSHRITEHAAVLLRQQMMRVAAEQNARSVPLNYICDFCSENPHLL